MSRCAVCEYACGLSGAGDSRGAEAANRAARAQESFRLAAVQGDRRQQRQRLGRPGTLVSVAVSLLQAVATRRCHRDDTDAHRVDAGARRSATRDRRAARLAAADRGAALHSSRAQRHCNRHSSATYSEISIPFESFEMFDLFEYIADAVTALSESLATNRHVRALSFHRLSAPGDEIKSNQTIVFTIVLTFCFLADVLHIFPGLIRFD